MKRMTVADLALQLQGYCHEGRALDEVEILDKDDNIVCVLDGITLIKVEDREVVQIKVHHKTEVKE